MDATTLFMAGIFALCVIVWCWIAWPRKQHPATTRVPTDDLAFSSSLSPYDNPAHPRTQALAAAEQMRRAGLEAEMRMRIRINTANQARNTAQSTTRDANSTRNSAASVEYRRRDDDGSFVDPMIQNMLILNALQSQNPSAPSAECHTPSHHSHSHHHSDSAGHSVSDSSSSTTSNTPDCGSSSSDSGGSSAAC